jgi:hypothetical protein
MVYLLLVYCFLCCNHIHKLFNISKAYFNSPYNNRQFIHSRHQDGKDNRLKNDTENNDAEHRLLFDITRFHHQKKLLDIIQNPFISQMEKLAHIEDNYDLIDDDSNRTTTSKYSNNYNKNIFSDDLYLHRLFHT